jgi:hypothetical protein
VVSTDHYPFLLRTHFPNVVAIVAGTILPWLSARDHRLLKPESEKDDGDSDDEEEEDRELVRIQEMVREWKAEAAREGRPLRLPTSKHRNLVVLAKRFDPSGSAVHAPKHLDMFSAAFRMPDVYNILH